MAAWPGWFPQVDAALVVLALGLGFLIASFTARNADIWLHLATGQRLVNGTYTPGTDPFSFTAGDRFWTNHNWLWDLVAYLLYSGTGSTLVAIKALAIVVAGGFLIAIRRPGFPLWPWAALTALAFLASAQRLILNPIVGSIVLLAATLYVLLRVPHRPGSWRTPLILGGIFWLWANVDAWFILGPLAVVLVLIGELIQAKFQQASSEVEVAEAEPIGPFPDVVTLLRTLGIGIVACMLNPHHVHVWSLPFELTGSSVIKPDPGMNLAINLAPTDAIFSRSDRLGYNLNGAAYAALLLGGGAVLALGVGRVRVSHLILWIGFALLSLITVYAIPFFALVAVPLIAGRLNAISLRIKLGSKSDQVTRLILLGSGGGRVLSVFALGAACVCAYPGWMQPPELGSNLPRYTAWAVEADSGLVEAAEQLQSWRSNGALPADKHGMVASITLSDYCAWFAPDEKVYINSSFKLHEAELPDYVAARGALWVYQTAGEPPDQKVAAAVLKKYKLSYLALYDSRRQIAPGNVPNLPTLRRMGLPVPDPTIWGILGWNDWTMWYQDGRTLIFGWKPGFEKGSQIDERLKIDPVRMAFGPDVKRLPAGVISQPPVPRTWVEDFTKPQQAGSPFADDALGWLDYKRELGKGNLLRNALGNMMFDASPLNPQGMTEPHFAYRVAVRGSLIGGPPSDGVLSAIPLIALRAARRAIAERPEHPDGYFALAMALNDPDLPITDGERSIWQVTALRQCLDRLPPPDQYRPGVYATSPTLAADLLSRIYLNPQQDDQGRVRFAGMPTNMRPMPDLWTLLLGTVGNDRGQTVILPFIPMDLALQSQQLAVDYAKREFAGLPEALYRNLVSSEEAQLKQLDRDVRDQLDRYAEATRDRPFGVLERLSLAMRFGLVGEAIRLLRETPDLEKEFGPGAANMALRRIALELAVGRIEESVADLEGIRESLDKGNPADPQLNALRGGLRLLEYHQAVIGGDYGTAGSVLEDLLAKSISSRPVFPSPQETRGRCLPIIRPGLSTESPAEVASWLLPGIVENRMMSYIGTKQAILNQVNDEGAFFFLRGFLSLLAGNISDARIRFEQSSQPLPPDWGFPPELPHPAAKQYLRLMDAAAKPR